MQNTDEPQTDSPLDAATIEYIDSEELTDTTTLVLPEPMLDKIAHVVHDGVAAISASDEDAT